MLTNYAYIAFYLVACILLAVVALGVPIILRLLKISPSKPDKVKTDTYECGMETTGRSWVQFNFRYYVYALMLIALDVLVVFLTPGRPRLRNWGQAVSWPCLSLFSSSSSAISMPGERGCWNGDRHRRAKILLF